MVWCWLWPKQSIWLHSFAVKRALPALDGSVRIHHRTSSVLFINKWFLYKPSLLRLCFCLQGALGSWPLMQHCASVLSISCPPWPALCESQIITIISPAFGPGQDFAGWPDSPPSLSNWRDEPSFSFNMLIFLSEHTTGWHHSATKNFRWKVNLDFFVLGWLL